MTLNIASTDIRQISPHYYGECCPPQNKQEKNIEENAGILLGSLVGLSCLALTAALAIKNKKRADILKQHPLAGMTMKLSDPWVDDYIKLCQKYGKKIRSTDGVAGNWQHYQELLLRETNPEQYKRYLADREIKAKTDETARILKELDEMGL